MEKRRSRVTWRSRMEALADCGSIDTEMETVSDEMEVTAGLIQKLVEENATRKLDQHEYRKKYDGYASRYAALESRMDSLEKERERKGIQYDLFSGFLAGLSETVDFNEKLFHRLVDYATVYPGGRVGGFYFPRRGGSQHKYLKENSGQVPGISGYTARRQFI